MNSGMGTLLTDSSAFAGADLFPASLDTTLNDVKTKMGTLDLTTLQNAVSRTHCDFFVLVNIIEDTKFAGIADWKYFRFNFFSKNLM